MDICHILEIQQYRSTVTPGGNGERANKKWKSPGEIGKVGKYVGCVFRNKIKKSTAPSCTSMREQCVDAAGVHTVTQRALGKKKKKQCWESKKLNFQNTLQCAYLTILVMDDKVILTVLRFLGNILTHTISNHCAAFWHFKSPQPNRPS